MKKDQKAQVVAEIAAQIEGAEAVYAVDYRGSASPRRRSSASSLREAGAELPDRQEHAYAARGRPGRRRTTSSRSSRRARRRSLSSRGDPALAAKALDTFARQAQVLEFKGGLLDGTPLDADEIRQLARLPGRDQLNAQLAGIVASPLTGLVRGSARCSRARDRARTDSARSGQRRRRRQPEPAAEEPTAERRPAAEEARGGGSRPRGGSRRPPRAPEEAPDEQRAERRKGGGVAHGNKLTQEWIEELKAISVMELSERIKALEEEFGVSATAVAAAAPAPRAAAATARRAEEEQTAFDVVLTSPATRRSR